MYKTLSRNTLSRSFRSTKAGSMRVRVTKQGKIQWGGGPLHKKRRSFKTEPELIEMLGSGPDFVRAVYRQYRHPFSKLGHEPKRCSAYLNVVAGIRMIDGSLWTDKAVESMFRRVLPKKA